MRFLRNNTATRVTVGPFLSPTDGVTPQTALTVTNDHLTFMVDTGGVPTLVLDTSPTASGGNNDMVHVTGDDAGYYDLKLAAADVNYFGRASLALTDATHHCPVFHEFFVLPQAVYDWLINAGDLPVNTTKISGTAQTARDLGASVLLSAGTGTGQLDFTAGVVKANLAQILGTALTETAGQIAAGVKKFFNVAVPAMDVTSANQTGDSFARIGAPAGASASADIAAVLAKAPDSAHYTNARGDKLDDLDVAVSTRLAASGYTAPDNADIAAIKAKTDNLPSDPADESLVIAATDALAAAIAALHNLSSAQAQSATAAALAAYDTTGVAKESTTQSILTKVPDAAHYTNARGDKLDDLDATVSSRLAASGYTAPDNSDITAIKAKTDNLPADPASSTNVAAVLAKTPDAAHFTNARGDKLDHLDADVSSRLPTSGYTAPDNADILLIKAKTDNLPSDPADESLIIAATNALATAIAALNNLSQANVRTAMGLASANLDAQLSALPAQSGARLVEGAYSHDKLLSIAAAGAGGGTREGFGTGAPKIKSVDGTKDLISGTAVDGQGNATITIDNS